MLKDFIPCCIPQSHPLPRTPAKPHRSTATATFCLHSTANQLRPDLHHRGRSNTIPVPVIHIRIPRPVDGRSGFERTPLHLLVGDPPAAPRTSPVLQRHFNHLLAVIRQHPWGRSRRSFLLHPRK